MGERRLIVFTVREIAEDLRVHPRTVLRWIKQGLPALNIGSAKRPDWRVEPDQLRAWLLARQETLGGKPRPGET